MITALIYFGASASVLLVLSTVYVIEDRHQERMLLVKFREMMDLLLTRIGSACYWSSRFLWHKLVQFILKHGVYRVLGAAVTYLRNLEQRVEKKVFRNRRVATREKRERTHLDEIADHKESVALSDKEKQRYRSHS